LFVLWLPAARGWEAGFVSGRCAAQGGKVPGPVKNVSPILNFDHQGFFVFFLFPLASWYFKGQPGPGHPSNTGTSPPNWASLELPGEGGTSGNRFCWQFLWPDSPLRRKRQEWTGSQTKCPNYYPTTPHCPQRSSQLPKLSLVRVVVPRGRLCPGPTTFFQVVNVHQKH